MKLSNPWMNLYVHSDNEKFRVVFMSKDRTEMNAFLEKNHDAGFIAKDPSGVHIVAMLKPE